MPKAIVIYHSRTGTTREMGEIVADELKAQGLEVTLKSVTDTEAKELLDYDCILAGAPTYYGLMSAEMKKLFDDSVTFHVKLTGKIGGAFSSSANVGGGNETTILSILNAMLIHGMVIKGSAQGDHYGPVAVGGVDTRAREQCVKLARETAALAKALCG